MTLRPVFLLLVVCSSSAALTAQSAGARTPLRYDRGPAARVAYVSDEVQNNVLELYSVPVDGSAVPLRLNDPLPTGGDTTDEQGYAKLQVAGGRVLYIADQLTNDTFELFSVPADGSAPPVRLNAPLVAGGDVEEFLTARERVVFVADGAVDEERALYSSPLDGSSPAVLLTPVLAFGQDVYQLVQFTRDESSVVFTTSWFGTKEYLYVVPTDGSQAPSLLDDSGSPPGFYYSFFPEIEIVPGDQLVVYVAAADDDTTIEADIFSARLDGSTPPIQLNSVTGAATYTGFYSANFRIDALGQRVLFCELEGGLDQLKSVFLDGSGLVNLVPAGQRADYRNYRISPAVQPYVVFATYGADGARFYRATLDGSQRALMLGPIAGPIMGLELIPGEDGVIYATGTSGDTVQVYALHAPHQPIDLTGSPPAGQGAHFGFPIGYDTLAFTPEGKRLIFRGDLDTDTVEELYSVLLDGSQPPQRLNLPLPSGRDVVTFRLAPGGLVLYHADQSANDVFELFSVPVDGSAPPVAVSATPVTGGDVLWYAKPARMGRLSPRP